MAGDKFDEQLIDARRLFAMQPVIAWQDTHGNVSRLALELNGLGRHDEGIILTPQHKDWTGETLGPAFEQPRGLGILKT